MKPVKRQLKGFNMLTTGKRISAKKCAINEEFRHAILGLINSAMAGGQSVISYRTVADVVGVQSHFAINAKSLDFVNRVAYVIEQHAETLVKSASPYVPVYIMGTNYPLVEFHKLDKAKEEYKNSFDFDAWEAMQALASNDTEDTDTDTSKKLTPSEKLERYLRKFMKDNPSFDTACLSAVFSAVGLPLEAIAETVNDETEATEASN